MQLGNLRDVRLDEHDRLIRADARGEEIQRHLVGILHQVLGGFYGRQGMVIHNTINAVILILECDVILDSAQVITQVLAPGGTRS